ncbi:cobalt transport protein CbiN [Pelotomaculum schinkii]|uniref:Cobalt transport protein CbiN n=1 Tax=Pelotomaculum schinkii TaxID=78350 RepID=A0A4Y7RF19_9FIRM|nr:PDGLE domain-containing protein [Pelotomaculum schinkii]TEB07584.1 cobalt transport protein CbiN [Pelotomaculum schinkii]
MNTKKTVLILLLSALVVAALLSPFASSSPDGLERVAEDQGFLDKGDEQVLSSPIPDYLFPGIQNEKAATSAAGVIGTMLTFGAVYVLGRIVTVRKAKAETKLQSTSK